MAAIAGIPGERRDLRNGHLIVYSENFLNFAGRLPISLYESFEFHCYAWPTSWSLRVTLKRALNDGSVSILVVIQRNDRGRIDVDVDISMAAFPMNMAPTPPIAFRVPYRYRCVQTRNFNRVIPYEVLRQLGDRSLQFQVSFAVIGCHVDDLKIHRKSMETRNRESKALFSKI